MIDWKAVEKTLFVGMVLWSILFVWWLEIPLLQIASTFGMLYLLVRVLNEK